MNQAVAIAGNPNAGKTAFFNLLTGSHQRVANFPGITVEKKEGLLKDSPYGPVTLIDLPGTYSLDADSPDEIIAQEIILGLRADTAKPEMILVVVDATHLERSLFLVSQLMELRLRMVLCLNMYDVACQRGLEFDLKKFSDLVGMPVIPTIATRGDGRGAVVEWMGKIASLSRSQRPTHLPENVETLRQAIAQELMQQRLVETDAADFWAGKIMNGRWRLFQSDLQAKLTPIAQKWGARIAQLKGPLELIRDEIQARHQWCEDVCAQVVIKRSEQRSLSDRVDRYLLHPFLGPLLFVLVMLCLFQAVFSWVTPLGGAIDGAMTGLGNQIATLLPDGLWRELLIDGVFAGVASVLVFVPQIMVLFLFIGLLESTGYMARAAFLVDRLMVRSGLTGKSFIPLLSSFACAVPGILATRTIKNEKDRLTTILVAPLMTCSARLPVYTLFIGAFVPSGRIAGMQIQGLVLFALYCLGILGAVLVAKVMRRTLLRGGKQMWVLELPDYKMPSGRGMVLYLWNRLKIFLGRVARVIVAASVVLWFLVSFPRPENSGKDPNFDLGNRVRGSYAGMIGRACEPLITPLGYDWKIGVALISSFAAREVFVSTLATLYNVGDDGNQITHLQTALRQDQVNGKKLFSLPMVLGLLVFFAFAMQCLSTVAAIRRETNSWRWPLFALVYTYLLAYGAAWFTYRVASFFLPAVN